MAIQQIPIKASPSQTLDIILAEQNVTIVLQARLGKLFADVALDNVAAVRGRLCHDRTQILNESYRGFKGEIFFLDKNGTEDPNWREINSRFVLLYWDGNE